jgi:hypothetical protein
MIYLNLSTSLRENLQIEKIDFFRSTSYVDFLKAHIKISFLYNSENTLIDIGPKTVCDRHLGTFLN